MLRKILNGMLNGFILFVVVAVLGLWIARAAGLTPYVVKSGSMEPKIMTGSLCFINTNIDYDSIKEGDIIAFRIATGNMVTHRVIGITNHGFETKGDNNDVSDGISTDRTNYVGKTELSVPKVGILIDALSTRRGMIIGVTLVLALILLSMLLSPDENDAQPGAENASES